MFLGENICSAGSHQYADKKSGNISLVFLFVLTLNIYTQVLKRSGIVWPFQQWSLVLLICHLLFLSSVSASPNTFYTFPTLCCANDTSWVSAGGKSNLICIHMYPLNPCLYIHVCAFAFALKFRPVFIHIFTYQCNVKLLSVICEAL